MRIHTCLYICIIEKTILRLIGYYRLNFTVKFFAPITYWSISQMKRENTNMANTNEHIVPKIRILSVRRKYR